MEISLRSHNSIQPQSVETVLANGIEIAARNGQATTKVNKINQQVNEFARITIQFAEFRLATKGLRMFFIHGELRECPWGER